MDPSCCDLEFFDFKDSSDEEIKEIQAILKGPGSCVKLPWGNPVKTKCPENLVENEGTIKETEAAGVVDEATPQVFVPPAAAPLPPAVETFVTNAAPYHSAPYFVSRTLPYLRSYPPPMVFACPLPGPGEANPYGFVPVTPNESEPGSKNQRQSGRRSGSKKRLSGGSDSPEGPYPQTSVPLVPPSTFVGGNLPLHSYPPGLHTSPAMYYVPMYHHPYGGYIQASGPPVMLPVDLKCPPPPLVSEAAVVRTADCEGVELGPTDSNGDGFESPEVSNGCNLTQGGNICHVASSQSNSEVSEKADNGCMSDELVSADDCSSPISNCTVEIPTVRSGCKTSSPCDVADTAAKTDVRFEKVPDCSKSPLSVTPDTSCFPEITDKCLETTFVPLVKETSTVNVPPTPKETEAASTVPKETNVSSTKNATAVRPSRPKETNIASAETAFSTTSPMPKETNITSVKVATKVVPPTSRETGVAAKVASLTPRETGVGAKAASLTPKETGVATKVVPPTPRETGVAAKAASMTPKETDVATKAASLIEAVRPVVRPSRCWADLFKSPVQMNGGFEDPPLPKRNSAPTEPKKNGAGARAPHLKVKET